MLRATMFALALVPAVGLGVAVGLGSGAALVAQEPQDVVSAPVARFSHQEEERYEMPLGVRSSGRSPRPSKLGELRDTLRIPDYYGNLVEITTIQDNTVFWYLSEGVLRNVVVAAADQRAYAITRAKASKLEIELRANK
ncbi:MAG: hypothetical protein AAF581_08080 [Planctomycetota bacterium]